MSKPTKLSEAEQLYHLRAIVYEQPRLGRIVTTTGGSYAFDEMHRELDEFLQRCQAKAAAELAAKDAEIARLREALGPLVRGFVDYDFAHDDTTLRTFFGLPTDSLTVGDFRRAAKAMED